MNKLACPLLISFAAMVTGCAIPPEYRPAAGASTAKLAIKGVGARWICVAGQRNRLAVDATGYADIPAGERLTIGTSFYHYVYGGVSSSCNPRASIIPEAGQKYYADFEIEANRCYTVIFKENPASRTGLALDPSFGSPNDCFGE